MDVTTALRRAATFFADREAVVHDSDRLTFAQAWERGCRMANGLIGLGLHPGDRVAVLEDNSKEAADFFLGAGIANLVRVPLYPRNAREAHLHMVGHTGCRALVVSGNYADEVADFPRQLPDLRHVLVRDEGYEGWLAVQSPKDPMLPIRPEDNYIIRHTGGTTGRSKGVAYTHKAWLACNRDWFYNYPPVEPGDKCLHVGPISHGSGYLFVPIWVWGGCNVMIDRFDPSKVVDIMEREGIAYMFAVPTMVNALISGGYNIWPLELENAIAAHPAVMEVAVFGIPDPRWGETPCAIVVPKPGAHVGAADIIQVCIDQLGSYKKPGKVVVRKEPLPKTPVGKIKRRDLREPYWVGHTRRVGGS